MHLYVFISSLDGAKLINKDFKYEKGMLEMYFAWIKKNLELKPSLCRLCTVFNWIVCQKELINY